MYRFSFSVQPSTRFSCCTTSLVFHTSPPSHFSFLSLRVPLICFSMALLWIILFRPLAFARKKWVTIRLFLWAMCWIFCSQSLWRASMADKRIWASVELSSLLDSGQNRRERRCERAHDVIICKTDTLWQNLAVARRIYFGWDGHVNSDAFREVLSAQTEPNAEKWIRTITRNKLQMFWLCDW